MPSHLRPAVASVVLFSALTGLAYPFAVTGIAQALMPRQANGSLIARGDGFVGSTLVGQSFTADRDFHGRPSATQAVDPADGTRTVDAPYNAANSGGSNLGPTSQKLVDRVKAAVAALGGGPDHPVPADAVTTSASGLDPDITPADAAAQAARVAAARGLPLDRVVALVRDGTQGPGLGIFGEARVNVLGLNLALDAAGGATTPPQKPGR